MAVDDLYRVTAKYCTPAGPVSVSQAYKQITGTNAVDTLIDLVDKIRLGWVVKLMLALASDVEFDALEAQPQQGVNEVPGYQNYDGVMGGVMGNAGPNAVAQVVSLLTDAPNSNANGRMFVAGIQEGELLAGAFSAAQVVLMQTFAADLADDVTSVGPGSATFRPVVISRFFESLPRGVPIGFDIINATAGLFPKQQRRRSTKRFGLT